MSVAAYAEVARLQYIFEWVQQTRACVLVTHHNCQDLHNFTSALRHPNGHAVTVERRSNLSDGFRGVDNTHDITVANVIVEAAEPIMWLEINGFRKLCSYPARRMRVNFNFTCLELGYYHLSSSQPLHIQADYWYALPPDAMQSHPLWFGTKEAAADASSHGFRALTEWINLPGGQVHTDPITNLLPWFTAVHALVRQRGQPAATTTPTPAATPSATVRFVRHRLFEPHLIRLVAAFVNPPFVYASIRNHLVAHTHGRSYHDNHPWFCDGCHQLQRERT